ncbi:ABC transporter substrate-binding protein [uncultured Legionella sp.]|uniref:ABC transporter substrate-binding protein n=1 Tax=uncultured Legionella sp. TaxID=210934 RepID=UPI00260EE0C9|nr:ABC transporter substrate-binding protein [uncultured Legionella sp.]
MSKLFISCLVSLILFLSGCSEDKNTKTFHFATSAEYPPFEYSEHGEIKGFDIDLARMVAKKLGRKAVFHNMQFSSILPAVLSGQVDMAISTITITTARQKNMDFSSPYYFEGIAAVFKEENPANSFAALKNKKIACQLGTTMELWVKKQVPTAELTLLDNNNQAIEALKAGHVDAVILDGAQTPVFSKKNHGLSYALIAKAEDGYGIALQKNATLTAEINLALKSLEATGEIQKLQNKWLENNQWNK